MVDTLETAFPDNSSFHKALFQNEAKGFVLENIIENTETQSFGFTINKLKSFEFEKMLTVVYFITLVWILHLMGKIDFLEKSKVTLILVKNFQYSQQSDSEDDQDKSQQLDIGMNQAKRVEML